MSDLKIGDLAERSGVGVETIRFYERKALIPQPEKPLSGQRRYPEEMVSRVRFIMAAKELGFSLKEIAELLDLRVSPEVSCAEVRRKAEARLDDIGTRIVSLQAMHGVLKELVAACHVSEPTDECPILEALERWEARNG
jgi:MerR family mercuric resistance operon transcriptional regulator